MKFHLRFVGSDTFPKSQSRRWCRRMLCLEREDIHELRPPRFQGWPGWRAVQLVMLRATGHH